MSNVYSLKTVQKIPISLDKAWDFFGSPANLQAIFNLAETFEKKGDKANAVLWYRKAQGIINIPEAKQELEQRIESLQ